MTWRSLGAELRALPLSEARLRGLPADAARRLAAHDPRGRHVLAVERLVAGAPAAAALRVGDLLLAVNGTPVTTSREVERAALAERISVALLRDGVRRDLSFETLPGDGKGTARIVFWSGAVLQDPPAFLALQRGLVPEGVYVASRRRGSPSERHGLTPTHRIVAMGGVPTPDLDAFLAALERTEGPVRLTTVDLDGRPSVTTLDPDSVDWPTWVLEETGGDWVRHGPGRPLAADSGS